MRSLAWSALTGNEKTMASDKSLERLLIQEITSQDGKRTAEWSRNGCRNLLPHTQDGGPDCDYGPVWFLWVRDEKAATCVGRVLDEADARRFVRGEVIILV